MRIGVVSDSHGDFYMLDKAIKMMGEVECIIHIGDHYNDLVKVNSKYNKEIYYVPGNNDYISSGLGDKVIVLNNKRILITHGHKYGVNFGLMNLLLKAEEEKADIVLYGHTHVYNVDYEREVFFLNPGSVSRPRDRVASAAVLFIDEKGDIYAEKLILSSF